MQVKRFFAADMRQAMKLVRDELGPDAAILGNRRVAGGIELTAALDYQAPPAPSKPNPALEVELRKTQARIAEARAELTARPAETQRKDRQLFAEEKPARPSLAESMTAAQAKPQAGGQTLEAMRFELNGLRELIEVQLGSIAWGQLQHQRPQQANLWRRLQRMGLPAELSKPLLERVAAVGDTRQAWRTCRVPCRPPSRTRSTRAAYWPWSARQVPARPPPWRRWPRATSSSTAPRAWRW